MEYSLNNRSLKAKLNIRIELTPALFCMQKADISLKLLVIDNIAIKTGCKSF